MQIQDKSIVSIHYRLTNDEGEVIDSSEGQEPLVYMQGTKSIVPGLERELSGKSVGAKLHVSVQPEDGYGPVRNELIRTAKPQAFNGIEEVKVGMTFTGKGPEGQTQEVIVEEVSEAGIKVNANHPLAGKVLHFDIAVEDVRAPTPEDLDAYTQSIDEV